MNRALALLLSAAFVPLCFAAPAGPTGAWVGSGRACYGTLQIQPATITWRTPFSACRSKAYKVVDHYRTKGEKSIAYTIDDKSTSCKFKVVMLVERDSGHDDSAWEAIGYGTLDS
jgi:hypothetical protein